MISMKMRTEGAEGFAEGLLEELKGEASKAVMEGGMILHQTVVQTLTGQRSGNTYVVPASNARGTYPANPTTYQASRPGEAPASRTGRLRNSMVVSRPEWQGDTVTSAVDSDARHADKPGRMREDKVVSDIGTNLEYARRMEYGGRHTTPRDVNVRMPDGWITVKAGTIINTAPRPYMQPSVRKAEPQILAMYKARGIG